ncbi:RidA family protein [Sporosarcina siberiensis]|uniref:RidA family protein n=1 Tax=Sporosarcina siberiensis TaxID=1365606 RepID=A0ABW4SL53_9BACL
MSIEKRIKELNIKLEEVKSTNIPFIPVNQGGNLLFTSGQVCIKEGKLISTGKLGGLVSIEEGQKSAEQCVVNCLSVLKSHLGDLDKIKKVVKVLAFVQSTEDFKNQPVVVNAASELILSIFGEKGKHARSAVGVNGLPSNASVEIEMIVEI